MKITPKMTGGWSVDIKNKHDIRPLMTAIFLFAATIASFLSGYKFGYSSGYNQRELQQFNNVHFYTNIAIIDKPKDALVEDSPGSFWMEFMETKKPFRVVICPNYKPPFRPGLQLKEIVFEDKGECWNLHDPNQKLGYRFYQEARE